MEEAESILLKRGRIFFKRLSNLKGRKQSRKDEAGGKRDGNEVKGKGEDLFERQKEKECLRIRKGQAWWCMPLILTLGRQRQADFCEFKTSLVDALSSLPVRSFL